MGNYPKGWEREPYRSAWTATEDEEKALEIIGMMNEIRKIGLTEFNDIQIIKVRQ